MFSKSYKEYDFAQDPEFKCMQNFFEFINTDAYARDFGQMINERPQAIFFPPSVELLQKFLTLASQYQVSVTCRGKGSSAFGQSQCSGVVIDLKNLNLKLEYASEDLDSIRIPAYYTWHEITQFTKSNNKTIPVTIDNLDLTVGGTLSFGAIGGTSYLCGSGADNVESLDVLTIDGERHQCSKTENSELFDAMLCGLGQFGIILSATIPLVDAKKEANMYLLSYEHSTEFFQEQKRLYELKVFDHLKGMVQKKEGKWEYIIEAACYFDEKEPEIITETLKQLHPNNTTMQNLSYWDFINLVSGLVQALREAGKLDAPHPWYNVFMPETGIEAHLLDILESPYLKGVEPIIVYPMNSAHFHQPLFVKPNSDTFYLLGVLYNTSFEATVDFPYPEVIKQNKNLFEQAKELNGCRYPVDAISFSQEDWRTQYGSQWEVLCALKEKYDPQCLLSTGHNLFPKQSYALNNELASSFK